MEEDFLKGNYKVKTKITEKKTEKAKSKREELEEEFEKAALNSIGGSMVYVKRTKLTWDGDAEKDNA